jgi:hypothetical protein
VQDEPTIGEQLRRLADQLTRVEARLAELVSHEKFEYTTREIATHQALQDARIDKIEAASDKQKEDQVQTRRLVLTAFLIPLGLVLLQFYLSSWSK